MGRLEHRIDLHPDVSSHPWRVVWMELEESLDDPYRVVAELFSEDVAIELDQLTGVEAFIELERDEHVRIVTGIVQRARYCGTFDGRVHVRVVIVPAWALMQYTRRSRCFHDLSVPEIVAKVAAETLGPRGRRMEPGSLTRSYSARDLCTQFRETDLELVTRLLAEEGISLVWDHEDGKEVAVLVDRNAAFVPVGESPVEFSGDDEPTLVPVATSLAADSEAIVSAHWAREMSTAGSAARAWNWRPCQPEWLVASPEATPCVARIGAHEDWQSRRLVESGLDVVDHTPQVASLMAERAASTATAVFRSNVLAMATGRVFALDGHPHPDLDREYVAIRARHRFEIGDDSNDGTSESAELSSELHCVPLSQTYRPSPRTRPEVPGLQMGMIVGPEGEDIHTDSHGRVLVHLPWDDQDATCWARVSQSWAGPGFGALVIPRIGMEVVVSFVDGNPDTPLVTGCVYNGANPPPVDLPADRTQTTLRSRTSPPDDNGHGGFNELRFDDRSGAEQIFMHAQRDLVQRVGADCHSSIGGDRKTVVGGEEEHRVKKLLTLEALDRLTIIGTPPVGKAPRNNDTLDVFGTSTTNVEGSWSLNVSEPYASGIKTSTRVYPEGLVIEAFEKIVFKVGGGTSITLTKDSIVMQAKTLTLESDEGSTIDVSDKIGLTSGGQVLMRKMYALSTATGPSPVVESSLDLAGGTAKLTAQKEVAIDTDAGASMQLDATVAVRAAAVDLEAPGDAAVRVGPAIVDIEAPTISANAKGPMGLKGKPISLN